MPTILACTDGSTYASSVYQHAAWAAQRLATGVEVLHVINHHRERNATHDLSGAIGFDASAELTEELASYEGLFDISNSSTSGSDEIKLTIKPGAEALGLTMSSLGRQVRQAFYGEEAQRVQRVDKNH